MPFKVPRVYPITDAKLSGLSHAEQVKRLIDGGATLIQLREKHLDPRDFYLEAAAAIEVARAHDVQIIINDRVDIALALGADGVHLGQSDLPPEAARRILGRDAIIGFSTHNLLQAELALDLPIDYVALGPIFATKSKQHTDPALGLDELQRISLAVEKLPLVAIGGIASANAQAVFRAGADSVALISDLVGDGQRITETMKKTLVLAGK
jgi:thiamine-phosphate pyrophosphorylase